MQQITISNIFRPFVNDTTTRSIAKAGLVIRLNTWLKNQEENRLFWLGMAVLGGIGTVMPVTLVAIVFFANNSFPLWVLTCAINVPVLIVNLAAQPSKVTLPVLFFAWFIDALIILYSLALFLTAA